MKRPSKNLQLFAGGGEMGELIRSKDWSTTAVGEPENWPQSLHTTLSIILKSKFPMFLFWGPELTCFYNDGYRPSLGNQGKHPNILGGRGEEQWKEIWPVIKPLIDQVLEGGEGTWSEDQLIPIYRNGKIEDVYWTFSYSPVNDESGKPAGVFVTCFETTDKVITLKKIEESEERFRTMAESSEILIAVGDETSNATYFNKAYVELTGRPMEDLLKFGWVDLVHPEDSERFVTIYLAAFEKKITFSGELRMLSKNGEYRSLLVKGSPRFRRDGTFAGYISSCLDITELKLTDKALRESERRLNILIEASELGTWEFNVKTGEAMYSKRYLEIIGGYTHDIKFTHSQLLEHLHPDDLPIREKALKDAFATGYLHYEARLIWKDKSVHWMEGRGKVFYDEENKPLKLIGTLRDITEQKKQQQELEESEKRFRDIIMQSPIPKAILRGTEHVVEMANTALLENIWRKKESEVTGKRILDIFPELKQQKYSQLLDEVYATGKTKAEAESLISLNGNDGPKKFYIDFQYAPLFGVDDRISGIKITAIDVTEKVEARKKIEESEKRFRSLAESLPQLVWETDKKGNALFASGRWQEYTGITPAGEAEWKAVIHPDDLENNSKAWVHSLSTGDIYKCDVRLKGKDGSFRWHSVIGEPVFDNENKIIKWVGAFTDIHAEKGFTQELEKQVESRTNELEKANKTLGQKNEELEKMNKELQSFAYISSHDLQEPLRKIQTFSTRILEKEYQNLSDSGRDNFQRMQYAAKRMQTLIDDLLTYSRTNTAERKFEKTDLNKIVQEVKEDLREELQQKHASIETSQMCEVHIIPFQFRQLLFNLVSNSLKFSNENLPPIITIKSEIAKGENLNLDKLSEEVNYCHISVSDNGIGFEAQYSEKIFELFQRLHRKDKYNGTGIGLAIVKKIVENHNGFITAKAEPNKGATFDIYFPQHQ